MKIGTAPTGGLRLTQAGWKVRGAVIDQTTYFRENVFSGSSWRSVNATNEQRSRGIALGIQLYEEKDNKENRKENRVEIWKKVGKRLPTVVARYFPTLALKEATSKSNYFDLGGRLRSEIISGREKKKNYG